MVVYSLDNLNLDEIKLMRQALNVIQITGASAIFVANLQVKLDNDIKQIETFIQDELTAKEESFKKITKSNTNK